MAKKKQKKGKTASAAKAEGAKLPKKIAGVKVPKELREPGGKLLDAVRHPLVMDVAAAALMAAAAGLRQSAAKDGADGTQAPRAKAPDLATLLTATALEGVRRLGESAARKGQRDGADADKGPRES